MNLLKGNGGANANHKSDFKDMGKVREPARTMPDANRKNTHCNYGPLQPTNRKK